MALVVVVAGLAGAGICLCSPKTPCGSVFCCGFAVYTCFLHDGNDQCILEADDHRDDGKEAVAQGSWLAK